MVAHGRAGRAAAALERLDARDELAGDVRGRSSVTDDDEGAHGGLRGAQSGIGIGGADVVDPAPQNSVSC